MSSFLLISEAVGQGFEPRPLKKVGIHCCSLFSSSSLAIYRFFLPNRLLEPLSVTGSEVLPSLFYCKFPFGVLHGKVWKYNVLFGQETEGVWSVLQEAMTEMGSFVLFELCMLSVVSHGLLSTWWTSFSLLMGERVPLKVISIKDSLIWWKCQTGAASGPGSFNERGSVAFLPSVKCVVLHFSFIRATAHGCSMTVFSMQCRNTSSSYQSESEEQPSQSLLPNSSGLWARGQAACSKSGW